MPTRRTVRVAEVLRKELSACMLQSLDLEGMLITISSVELPPDMRQAYVYVSTLNPEVEQGTGLAILNRNRKEWQSRIGRRLGLKFTPQLIFRFDDAIERGDRVMEILTKLHLDEEAPEKKKYRDLPDNLFVILSLSKDQPPVISTVQNNYENP